MVVPFGFSVGDCIAVCILIKDAIKALDDYGGSSTEYQEIIRELWALDRALLEIEMISRSHDATATTSNIFLNATTSASVPSEFEQKSKKRKSMSELQEDNMRLFKKVRLMERIFQQDVDILKDNHSSSEEVQSRS